MQCGRQAPSLTVSSVHPLRRAVQCCLLMSVALTLGQSVVKALGQWCWFIGKEEDGWTPGTIQEITVTFCQRGWAMVFRELTGNGAPPRNPQHALLLLVRTEAPVVPAALEASVLPLSENNTHPWGSSPVHPVNSLWCWDSSGFL